MFDSKKMHLIPPLLQDHAQVIMNNKDNDTVRENYAVQFEAIIEYCRETLTKYQQLRGFIRKIP